MRLSKEREQEIRKRGYGASEFFCSCDKDVPELLSEIDALRKDLECNNSTCDSKTSHQNVWCDHVIQRDMQCLIKERDNFKWEYENVCKFATQYEQERDQFKAENEKLLFRIIEIDEEKNKLRERIEHMKGSLKFINQCGIEGHKVGTADMHSFKLGEAAGTASKALAQDDELSQNKDKTGLSLKEDNPPADEL